MCPLYSFLCSCGFAYDQLFFTVGSEHESQCPECGEVAIREVRIPIGVAVRWNQPPDTASGGSECKRVKETEK